MRIAPIGIFYAAHDGSTQHASRITAIVAADAARITHLHDLSTLSAVFAAIVIFDCMRIHVIDRLTFRSIISNALSKTLSAVPNSKYAEKFIAIIQKSIDLADSTLSDQ